METYTYTYRIEVLGPAQGNVTDRKLPDLTGFAVEALDGHIGTVDEATYDDASSCLVVDTGFWIFGKQRMIPAGVVQRVDVDEKKVYVEMTKDQIKLAPDHDAERHLADEDGYHREVGAYYDRYMIDSPLF